MDKSIIKYIKCYSEGSVLNEWNIKYYYNNWDKIYASITLEYELVVRV